MTETSEPTETGRPTGTSGPTETGGGPADTSAPTEPTQMTEPTALAAADVPADTGRPAGTGEPTETGGATDTSAPAGGRGAQLKHTGLRPGWTTGACATAATTAAYTALLTGEFPDPVTITLPRGQTPAFALAREELGAERAMAAVVKDAGDDPDVTHGAVIHATVRPLPAGAGVVFRAGPGVGTVTRPGLPLEVGEPAVNPVPRRMMREHVARVAAEHGGSGDVEITLSVEGGEELARSTWNPRLGILGGLSILGTTGIVVPYSCSAWIDSIRRGVDVARAAGRTHVAGCTGSTSERTVVTEYGLPEDALLDMGDFAGAVLKYVRRHPVDRLTVCGGFAKLSKLAAGHLDLHSKRSQVDKGFLARLARRGGADEALADRVSEANTGLAALQMCAAAGVPLGDLVAEAARDEALRVLRGAPVRVDVLCIDRAGTVVGRSTVR
ncbi:cobalt-precorrin-5B (C(1))-methyltransferase [Streptomyces albus]|uniref:cobalt-precorrin-5B (C(1))-methyltransferase n=2 Tax=Streptomyces TaxID=1883 RepID=UPI00034E8C6E|nr:MULTISPECIES: cobalt-precorrin-5B (C(1))-methyltransferase [Streptomyces]EPD89942.1 cobalamin biosynthesis protein CbiD [Streptomyces sp. HPH0547]GHJ23383.1 cobalt-precorrin-5B C(1)-methyltransferase [Streptomyces albus]